MATGPYSSAIANERNNPQREQEAYQRVQEFDPRAALEESTQGVFGSFRENLKREIANLRGAQASMGRVGHGFQFGDEDQLIGDLADRQTNELRRNALTATNMDLAARQYQHGASFEGTNRYYDLLGGQRDYEIADQNARDSRKRNLLSGIGTVLGGGAGLIFGGPAGGAAGARIGGSLGGIFY